MQLSYHISSKSFIRILVITFAISFLLSFDLWGNDRTFPLFPILNLEINWIHKLVQYGFLIITFTSIIFAQKELIKIFLFFSVFFNFSRSNKIAALGLLYQFVFTSVCF